MPVAKVNQVAAFEQTLRWCGVNAVTRLVPTLGQAIEHLVRRIAVRERPVIARLRQDRRLGMVNAAAFEFVMATDVIEMGMARDTMEGSFRNHR